MSGSVFKRVLLVVFLGVSIAGIVSAIHFPLYNDEIVTRIVGARFFEDGIVTRTLFPQCASAYVTRPTLTAFVQSGIESILYYRMQPERIRLFGIFSTLAWFVLLFYLCKGRAGARACGLFAVCSALSLMGVLPWLLTMNRFENVIIICFAALLVLFRRGRALSTGSKKTSVIWIAILALTLVCFSYHPKSVLFFPFFLSLGFFDLSHKKWFAGFLAWLLLLSLISVHTSSVVWSCPESKSTQVLYQQHFVPPQLLRTDPKEFFHQLEIRLEGGTQYLAMILFNKEYQSDWIQIKTGTFAPLINKGILWSFFAAGGYFLFAVIRSFRRITPINALVVLGFLGAVATLAFRGAGSFYESKWSIPFAVMLGGVFFAESARDVSVFERKFRSVLGAAIICVSLVSQIYFLSLHNTRADMQKSLASAYPGDALRKFAYEACGIVDAPGTHTLILDESTFFYYQNTYRPLALPYIFGYWGMGVPEVAKDYRSFYQSLGSDGVLIYPCVLDSPDLNPLIVRDSNGACCISGKQIKFQSAA